MISYPKYQHMASHSNHISNPGEVPHAALEAQGGGDGDW